MAGREDALWAQVHTLVATRRPRDYDEAVGLLRDLRALAGESGGLDPTGLPNWSGSTSGNTA